MANLEQSRSWIPDACKTYIFINSNLPSYKNWKKNQKFPHKALIVLLWVKMKNADFLPKNADLRKIKGVLVLKDIFSENTDVCTYVPNFKFLS